MVDRAQDGRFQRTLALSVGLPVMLAGALALTLLGLILYLLHTAGWVVHTDEAIGRGFRLQAMLVGAESSVRGYLITGQQEMLQPYIQAEGDVPLGLRGLQGFVGSQPAPAKMLARVEPKWVRWRQMQDNAVALRQSGGNYAEIVGRTAAAALMREIRSDVQQFIDLEEQLRQTRLNRSRIASIVVISASVGLASGLGVGLGAWSRRTLLAVARGYQEALREVEQRRQQLAGSEATNRELIASVPDYAIFRLDADGCVASWNQGAERLMGYSTTEIIGQPLATFYPSERRDEAKNHLQIAGEVGHYEELGWRLGAGGKRFFGSSTLTAIRNEQGTLVGFSHVAHDISDRHAAEQALRESESLLRAILTSAQDAIVATSADGIIESMNPAAERMFGYETDELLGAAISRVIVAQDGAMIWSSTTGRINAIGRRKDGKQFPIELSMSQFVRQNRQVLTGIIRDITERKQAEEEIYHLTTDLERRVHQRTLELQHAIEDLDAFALTVSHDLRAPLRNLQEFAKALLEEHGPALGEEGEDFSRRIVAGAARMDRLVQDLLDYARVARSQVRPERINLPLIINQVIGLIRQEAHGAHADFIVREPMPPMLAHRPTLVQILYSLLDNAVKFVAPGVKPVITIYVEDRGQCVRVNIEDNGIGIEQQHRETIFRPFERLHAQQVYHGSGLGLALVKRGMDKMRGRAGVESAPGGGSRFWIELPKTLEAACHSTDHW